MKGKKFDAAEKHFLKKEEVYRKKISALEKEVAEKSKLLADVEEKVQNLESENEQMKDWVDRLLKYTELSQADIKKVCEKDKAIASLLEVLKGGYFNGTRY